ncbi:MAG: ATP-binding protein [Candidatus Woesearchaeota archaeon]
MKIHLPNSAFLGNIDPFLRSFDSANSGKLVITSNKKWISIHPLVLSMVAALGLNLSPDKIDFENLEAKSKHYLERMGLFKILEIKSRIKIKEHEPAGRFIPLSKIKDSAGLTEFITEMVPLLHLEPKQAEPIRYVVSELVRNVLEHSKAKDGALVAAQYYKKSNTIRIGIVDTGVGIKETIGKSYHVSDDLEAIRLALMPGITGTTRLEGGTELNAGAGMFFIKSIAKVNKSFFVVYSGRAMYKLLKSEQVKLYADPFKDRHSEDENLPFWQGTAVGIDISLDDTKKFSALLDLIRDVYIQAIRERRKETYKKRRPRFI